MWVGEDVYLSPNIEIRRQHLVYMGDHIAIDSGFYCTTGLEIGCHVHVGPHVSVIGGANAKLIIGDFCTISAGTTIACMSDDFSGDGLVTAPGVPKEYMNEVSGGVLIMENFASIGMNASIKGVGLISEGVVIGMGAVVTRPIFDPWTVWVGNPARKIKDRPREKMLEYAKELTGYSYE